MNKYPPEVQKFQQVAYCVRAEKVAKSRMEHAKILVSGLRAMSDIVKESRLRANYDIEEVKELEAMSDKFFETPFRHMLSEMIVTVSDEVLHYTLYNDEYVGRSALAHVNEFLGIINAIGSENVPEAITEGGICSLFQKHKAFLEENLAFHYYSSFIL